MYGVGSESGSLLNLYSLYLGRPHTLLPASTGCSETPGVLGTVRRSSGRERPAARATCRGVVLGRRSARAGTFARSRAGRPVCPNTVSAVHRGGVQQLG